MKSKTTTAATTASKQRRNSSSSTIFQLSQMDIHTKSTNEIKSYTNPSIGLEKKIIYLNMHWQIQLSKVYNFDNLLTDVEDFVKRLEEMKISHLHDDIGHKNGMNDEEYKCQVLTMENKKYIYTLYFNLDDYDSNVKILKCINQVLKVLLKLDSKQQQQQQQQQHHHHQQKQHTVAQTFNSKSHRGNRTYDDGYDDMYMMDDEYFHMNQNKSFGSKSRGGQKMSSFGRVNDTKKKLSSVTTPTKSRGKTKQQVVYSSKNTRLNFIKKKAYEKDMHAMDEDRVEDTYTTYDTNNNENNTSMKIKQEQEPTLENDDEDDNEQDGMGEETNDDPYSMSEDESNSHDGKKSRLNSKISTKRKHSLDDTQGDDACNHASRMKGRRRLMKKIKAVRSSHDGLSDSEDDLDREPTLQNYADDDDDDDGDEPIMRNENDNDAKDDHNDMTTITTTESSVVRTIAAVSPTQLLPQKNSMMNNTSHHDTVTDDDDDKEHNEGITMETNGDNDGTNKKNHEEDIEATTQNIQKFFGPRVTKKDKRRNHRGKTYSSSADQLLGLSPESIPTQTMKTPPRRKGNENLSLSPVGNVSTSSLSPSSSKVKTKSPIKNPYKSNSSSPPKKTNSSGHIGLRNLGNTCYINASLQMLFSLPNFISSLQQTYDHYVTKNNTFSSDDTTSFPMPITRAFLKVAWDAKVIKTSSDGLQNTEDIRSVNPRDLKEAIDLLTDKFAGYEQRDSHEFLSALIDYIHEELVIGSGKQNGQNDVTVLPTDDYFRMNVKVCLSCDGCNYRRCKEELYRHLSIDVGQSKEDEEGWTVDKSLDQFFIPEVRDIRCEKCNHDTATQTIEVLSRPKAILLHLKRFMISDQCIQKNTGRIEYNKHVSLERFYDESLRINKDTLNVDYNLCGIVRHIGGTASSGHYTANCERTKPNIDNNNGLSDRSNVTSNKEWVSFDDGLANVTTLSNVVHNERNQRTAYMILYGIE